MSESFDKWYQHYPLKVSKGAARKAFEKLNPSEVLVNKMISAIYAQVQHRKLMTAAGQFVPPWKYPATWIRAECWDDELPTIETKANGWDKTNDIEAMARRLNMQANPGESWEQFGIRVRRANDRPH